MLKWEGPLLFLEESMKPSLTRDEQAALLVQRGLSVDDQNACTTFLAANNYYRFSGYARYFQQAPHLGDDSFALGTDFDQIRMIYEADEALRVALVQPLARVELLLRAHTAYVVADVHGPRGRYLEEDFYTDVGNGERTVESCLRDIERSKERHILRFKTTNGGSPDFSGLPIWSAVEAWSFGTLSKCIERGAQGTLDDAVAASLGVAKAGFAYRVRSLVYLRNRCAHHSRLWHHSVIDAGPTPNNVRAKAKKLAGQFEPRSVLDVIASLDDMLVRSGTADPILPKLVEQHPRDSAFWEGLVRPQSPRDHQV
ncbi:Abi family protein [Paenarthrobacter sp. NPDC056912]|uniref:Abi family protein n=1 Tax=Paenarthrobacter sp. NPDC056912 TaxID=3345965 RepID=UPI00366E7D8C